MWGFQLSGWQWVAIVLSVLWVIGAWLYTMNDLKRDAKTISVTQYDYCVAHRSDSGEDCSEIMNQVRAFQMALARKQAAARALLPIPLWWLAIWLVNVMARSMRGRFQQ
jgi:hypothetical protein